MANSSILARVVLFPLIAVSTSAGLKTEAQESNRSDAILLESVDRGFLFIDRQYVSRPYEFRREGDAYLVNDINLASIGIDLSGYEERTKLRQEQRDRKKSRRKQRDPIERLYSGLKYALNEFETVFLISGSCPIRSLGTRNSEELLRVLVDKDKRVSASNELPKGLLPLIGSTDQLVLAENFSSWLASFEPSPNFLVDATARLEFLDTAVTANEKSSAATLRLATFGYPLTILMMILVVLGFGHLLSHRPNTDQWNDDSPTNQISEPFNRSLLLIAGLSAVDLIWTLLVSQAGAMHELNPIGSQMIDDPLQLVAFKVLLTLAAVGLLYFCRRVPLARQASWWSCLVLTLVAARWLVFHSMFIS